MNVKPVTTTALALPLRPNTSKNVSGFERGKILTSFFTPQGRIFVPRESIQNKKEAEKFALDFATALEKPIKTIEIRTAKHEALIPKMLDEKNNWHLFSPAPDRFPETPDSLMIEKRTQRLFKDIEFDEEEVKSFVEKKLKEPLDEDCRYLLIYHNQVNQQTGERKLKADALLLLHQAKLRSSEKEATLILIHKLNNSTLEKVSLEPILKKYSQRIIVALNQVEGSRELYRMIYSKVGEIDPADIPIAKNIWPFSLPTGPLADFRIPRLTQREKYKLFKEAIKKDSKFFGLLAIGRLFYNVGIGLLKGALLYSILALAQDVLKVLAGIGVAMEFFPILSYMLGINKASDDSDKQETRENLGKIQDKQFPRWNMVPRFKTNCELIKREAFIASTYMAASAVFFLLFPPIFTGLWGVGLFAAGLFATLYISFEVLNYFTDALSHQNAYMIAEKRLRRNPFLPQFKKYFWAIRAFQDNIETILSKGSLAAGIGFYSLAAHFSPSYATVTGISLGTFSLLLHTVRFILPLFGKAEKSSLLIESPDYLMMGGIQKFTDNIFLDIRNNNKVEVYDSEDDYVLYPNFTESGTKLIVSNLENIAIKNHWLTRILPFKFAKKQIITIKTKDKDDPPITLFIYSGKTYTPEQIEQRFIERV